jgi:hypothetical protein
MIFVTKHGHSGDGIISQKSIRVDILVWLWMTDNFQHTVSAVAIAQIQSDGQGLPRNIPALLLYCGANLLHCRSISSHFISYLGQSNRIRA